MGRRDSLSCSNELSVEKLIESNEVFLFLMGQSIEMELLLIGMAGKY